jgi:proteic killer suppression protein
MLRSFRSKALKRFAESGDSSKLAVRNVQRVEIILRRLDAARTPEHMNLPGLFFHALKGQEKGRFSVRVTGNFRMTFGWDEKDAIEVDLEDYH